MNPTLKNLAKSLRVKGKCIICGEPATALSNLGKYCSKCYEKVYYKNRIKRNLIKSQEKNLRKKLRYLTETEKHKLIIKQQKELK